MQKIWSNFISQAGEWAKKGVISSIAPTDKKVAKVSARLHELANEEPNSIDLVGTCFPIMKIMADKRMADLSEKRRDPTTSVDKMAKMIFQSVKPDDDPKTSNLGKFVNSLCLNFGVEFRNGDDIETANDALREGDDRAMLKLMREETTLLVLMVRLRNQERHEQWEAEQAEKGESENENLGI